MTTTENIRLAAAIFISIACLAGLWYLWRPSFKRASSAETKPLTEQLPSSRRGRKRANGKPAVNLEDTSPARAGRHQVAAKDTVEDERSGAAATTGTPDGKEQSLTSGAEDAAKRRKRRKKPAIGGPESEFPDEKTLPVSTPSSPVEEVTDTTLETAPESTLEDQEGSTDASGPVLLAGLFDLNKLQRENDELLGRDWFGTDDAAPSGGVYGSETRDESSNGGSSREDAQPASDPQSDSQSDSQTDPGPASVLPNTLGAMIGKAAIDAVSSGSSAKVDPLQLLFAQTPLTEGAVHGAPMDSVPTDSSQQGATDPSEHHGDDYWGASAAGFQPVDEAPTREEQRRSTRLEKAERRRVKRQNRRDRRAKNRDARQTELRPPTKREIRRELRASTRAVKAAAAAKHREEKAAEKRQLKEDQQAMREAQREARKVAARKLGLDQADIITNDAWSSAAVVVADQAPQPVAPPPAQPQQGLRTPAPPAREQDDHSDIWPADEALQHTESVEWVSEIPQANVLDLLFKDTPQSPKGGEAPRIETLAESDTSRDSAPADPWAAAASVEGAPLHTPASNKDTQSLLGTSQWELHGLPEPLPNRNVPTL